MLRYRERPPTLYTVVASTEIDPWGDDEYGEHFSTHDNLDALLAQVVALESSALSWIGEIYGPPLPEDFDERVAALVEAAQG